MFRPPNKILIAVGATVAVIAAMAGPAGARTAAGANPGAAAASTPVPVDITGNITWTISRTPSFITTGAETLTGNFHVDMTNVVNNVPAAINSTYSITDNIDESETNDQGCGYHVTGSTSASGSLAPFLDVTLQLPSNPNVVVTSAEIPFTETQTEIYTGPTPTCSDGTFTNTLNLSTFGPVCYDAQGNATPMTGVFQGTYPNGTVNLGCSGTYVTPDQFWRGSYSVTGTLTISPSCDSAATSSSTPASSSSAASARSATSASASSSSSSCPVHYTVTVEQWIPQSSVVDPAMPLPLPYLATFNVGLAALDPNCLQPPLPNGIYSSIVRSSYHGDGHTDFGGSYREEFEIEFDFDGQSITNFKEDTPQTGTTIRNKTYTAHGSVIASCSKKGQAAPMVAAAQTGDTTFTMSSAGKNPLTPPALTPSFSTALSGSLNANGDLQLSGSVTDFPSQGIQVTENGQPVLTDVDNDVSCLSESQVTGLQGIFNLTRGLLSSHDVDATASGAPLSEDNPSPLC